MTSEMLGNILSASWIFFRFPNNWMHCDFRDKFTEMLIEQQQTQGNEETRKLGNEETRKFALASCIPHPGCKQVFYFQANCLTGSACDMDP